MSHGISSQSSQSSSNRSNNNKGGRGNRGSSNNNNSSSSSIMEYHPKCKQCFKRFYDVEKLLKHWRDQHFICDICREIDHLGDGNNNENENEEEKRREEIDYNSVFLYWSDFD